MDIQAAVVTMVEALTAGQIPYMLVGSFSTSYWGIPRSTKDGDFVIAADSPSVKQLRERLGPQFQFDPQRSFESVTATMRRIVTVPETDIKIELFDLSRQPHDQERFARRVTIQWLGREVVVPTAEDVIITKLFWALNAGRGKDRDDVRDVIAVQGERLDFDYIHRWAEEHGTRELLDEIRRSIPPM
jgi:hypothetical protein